MKIFYLLDEDGNIDKGPYLTLGHARSAARNSIPWKQRDKRMCELYDKEPPTPRVIGEYDVALAGTSVWPLPKEFEDE